MNRLTERYKIARLIARKVSGTISEEEADELEAWVGSSARYREEVTRIESRLREDIRQGRELQANGICSSKNCLVNVLYVGGGILPRLWW